MLMLLSTLVPTAVHFGMVLLSPFVALWLAWFRDEEVARRLADVPADYTGDGSGGPLVGPVIDDAADRLTKAWFWAIVTTAACLAVISVGFQQAEQALPILQQTVDHGLDWFKATMLWVAYGFDQAPVEACLAQAR